MIDDSTDRLLVNCRIEYFARVKSAELTAFIYAHDPEVKLKNQIPKNVGKLEDAKDAIERGFLLENNWISTAYKCRDKPNIQNAKHKKAQPKTSQNEEVEHTLEDVTTVISFSNDNGDDILPSKLLEHEEWLKRMHILFGIDDMLESFSVKNAMKMKGDYLAKYWEAEWNNCWRYKLKMSQRELTGLSTLHLRISQSLPPTWLWWITWKLTWNALMSMIPSCLIVCTNSCSLQLPKPWGSTLVQWY